MSTPADVVSVLSKAPIYSGLGSETLKRIATHGRRRAVRRGEVIFAVGDPGNALFAILSGRVVLSRVTSEGKELALASMETGDTFGELALIDGEPRSADATVVEAGDLFVLDRASFLAAVEAEPAIALSFLREIARRLRATNRLAESVSWLELRPRLARLLLTLARRGETTSSGAIVLASRYTQGELAKHIAASRESVSKELTSLTREGVIELRDGRIVLLEVEALELWADDPEMDP